MFEFYKDIHSSVTSPSILWAIINNHPLQCSADGLVVVGGSWFETNFWEFQKISHILMADQFLEFYFYIYIIILFIYYKYFYLFTF